MHEIAVHIFESEFSCEFNVRWLSKESNIRADMLSKSFDSDDSGIKQNVLLTNQGGRIHVIDSPLTTMQSAQRAEPRTVKLALFHVSCQNFKKRNFYYINN